MGKQGEACIVEFDGKEYILADLFREHGVIYNTGYKRWVAAGCPTVIPPEMLKKPVNACMKKYRVAKQASDKPKRKRHYDSTISSEEERKRLERIPSPSEYELRMFPDTGKAGVSSCTRSNGYSLGVMVDLPVTI